MFKSLHHLIGGYKRNRRLNYLIIITQLKSWVWWLCKEICVWWHFSKFVFFCFSGLANTLCHWCFTGPYYWIVSRLPTSSLTHVQTKLKEQEQKLLSFETRFHWESWPSGLVHRTQALVLSAAECELEFRSWHWCL